LKEKEYNETFKKTINTVLKNSKIYEFYASMRKKRTYIFLLTFESFYLIQGRSKSNEVMPEESRKSDLIINSLPERTEFPFHQKEEPSQNL
jgi:hypothetical protein